MVASALTVFASNGVSSAEAENELCDAEILRSSHRTSDATLVGIERLGQHCRAGDAGAWTSLFPIVWPVLVTFTNRLYHSFDQEDAEDAAQAALEAAISGIDTFSGRAPFRAWLFGIASQQARTLFRRKSATKRGLTLLVPIGESAEYRDETAKSPCDATAEKDRAVILDRALERLSEDDRDLIHLHFFGELTFREIALVRNMNPKTVCTRLTRCKAKLLELLIESNLTRADG
ncbi:MAG: RNA polymerase sigma factor [Chthoniobacterales bacterium]